MPDSYPPDELAKLFQYDPDTGLLAWRVDRPPRVKAGDEAGTLTKDGYVLVTLGKRKLLGHHIAWAMYYGDWPEEPLMLAGATEGKTPEDRRRSRSNLAIDNIVSKAAMLSGSPAAIRQRAYTRRLRENKRGRRALQSVRNHSDVAGVTFSSITHRWTAVDTFSPDKYLHVRNPDGDMERVLAPRQKLGEYIDREDAERRALDYVANQTSLQNNPVPATMPEDLVLTAGPHGDTLAQFNRFFCYDADRGLFIWRTHPYGPKETWPRGGSRADRPNTAKTLVLNHDGKIYPAHLVAWFMATKQWPRRKAIEFKNGNRQDIRLANLRNRDE